MKKSINHQAIELKWLYSISNIRTLVLGSYNPYHSSNPIDFYYGRTTNYFWRIIANLIGKDENYFFDNQNGLSRKLDIMQNRFYCLDVINSIEFSCDNEKPLNDYLKNKIYSNFLDQNIWVTNTKYSENERICLSRTYNEEIVNTLQNSASIKKVIHTMGKNRITEKAIYPIERNLNDLGFKAFMRKIISICREKNIEFVYNSISPSGYAISTGTTKINDLSSFLNEHLWLSDYKK